MHPDSHLLTRDCRDSARVYGLEARRFFAENAWADVADELARGWLRVRRDSTPWTLVQGEVLAGWQSLWIDGDSRR